MSWVYVPGSAGLNLESDLPDPTRAESLTWRGKPQPAPAWSRRWKQGGFIRRLSGLTLPLSTADRGVASWIASLRAIRASPTASPESAREKTMTAGCSITSSASSTKSGLRVSSERTSRGTRTDSLNVSSQHWSDWATALRQEYSLRPKWGQAIGGNACSSWPTATAGDAKSSGNRNLPGSEANHGTSLTDMVVRNDWATPCQRDHFPPHTPEYIAEKKAEGHGMRNLNDEASMWPTPRTITGGPESAEWKQELGRTESGGGDIQAAAIAWTTPSCGDGERGGTITPAMSGTSLTQQVNTIWQMPAKDAWPTPAARDYKGSNSEDHVTTNGTGRMHMDQLPNFVEHGGFQYSAPAQPIPDGEQSSPERRSLNPLFVEWLMGWPTGLSGFVRAETAFTRWQQDMRGLLLMLASPPPPEQASLF